MKLQTASSVISLAKELENKTAKFYEDLAERYAEGKDSFLAFAAVMRFYSALFHGLHPCHPIYPLFWSTGQRSMLCMNDSMCVK